MPRLQEYTVERSFRYSIFHRLPGFAHCTFRTDAQVRPRFCYWSGSVSGGYAEVAVYGKTYEVEDLTYVKVRKLTRWRETGAVLVLDHYVDLFSRFTLWFANYTLYLAEVPDADYATIQSFIES